MPLYPYRCTQCGHTFEKIQNFSDEPETACPKCGGVLERPLTAPRLNFKGAGWYVNDYAPKSSGSSDSSPSESKPAAAEPAASDGKKSGDSATSAPAAAPSSSSSTPSSSGSTGSTSSSGTSS